MQEMKVWSWRQVILKSKLQATTKLVLLALSTYMNDHGQGCYPSQEQIALDTSLTERSVITHIGLAIQAGFLIKDKRQLRGKKWDANEYRASTPGENAAGSPHGEGVKDIHPTTEARGEPASLEGCTTFTSGVNHVHTNSSKNSSMNVSAAREEKNNPDSTHTNSGNLVLKKEWIDFAIEEKNVTEAVVNDWFADFCEYYSGKTFQDWDRRWRKWVRMEIVHQGKDGAKPKQAEQHKPEELQIMKLANANWMRCREMALSSEQKLLLAVYEADHGAVWWKTFPEWQKGNKLPSAPLQNAA